MSNLVPFPAPRQCAFGRKPLTPRQRECVDLAYEGYTDAEIGILLGIATKTVKALLLRAYDRLGVHNRIAAGRALDMQQRAA